MKVLVALLALVAIIFVWTSHLDLVSEAPSSPSVPTTTTAAAIVTTEDAKKSLDEPNHDAGAPNIHFITVQTNPTPTWCRMLLSAFLSGGITVHNLAWGARYGHIKRPAWILEYLLPLPLDDIVLFADGGDTMYSGFPPSHIAELFEKLSPVSRRNGEHHSFLFNAEANCYHQQTFQGSWGVKKGKCLSAYKRFNHTIRSRYRYLNAGAWIARVSAAKKIFSAAQEIIKRDSSLWCDQSVFGGMYLSGKYNETLGLDSENDFFLPTYHLRASRDLCPLQRNVTAPDLTMCHSGRVPSLIHFNGKSEGRFTSEIIQRTLWFKTFSQKSARENVVETAKRHITVLHSPGKALRRVTINEVCPHLEFPS